MLFYWNVNFYLMMDIAYGVHDVIKVDSQLECDIT